MKLKGDIFTFLILGFVLIFLGILILIDPKFYDPIYDITFDFSAYKYPLGILMIIIGVLFVWSDLSKKELRVKRANK